MHVRASRWMESGPGDNDDTNQEGLNTILLGDDTID